MHDGQRRAAVQLLSIGAAFGMAAVSAVACGGAARAPVQPVTSANPMDAVISARPVVIGSRESALLVGPGALEPQRASAHLPQLPPSYAGIWSGRSIRRACIEAGGAVGVACPTFPDRNRVQIEIAQSGDRVQAELILGGQRAALTGRVRPDGTLTLQGAGRSTTHTITVRDWRANFDASGMQGTFSYVIAADDERLGSVIVSAALDGLTSTRSRIRGR